MKSADEYAELAGIGLGKELPGRPLHAGDIIASAQVYATLALAAATLEAARLTLDAQASNLLSALDEPEPETTYCPHEWPADGECPKYPARVHRCHLYAVHCKEQHLCACGSEL